MPTLPIEWIIPIIILALIALLIGRKNDTTKYTYKKHNSLFSKAERSFLGVLEQALPEPYRAFGKVRVADVITPQKSASQKTWLQAFNRISAKHFDYVICNKNDLSVVAVIELDDKSHSKSSTKKRDEFLNHACETADLPIMRVKAKKAYTTTEITEQFHLLITPKEQQEKASINSGNAHLHY